MKQEMNRHLLIYIKAGQGFQKPDLGIAYLSDVLEVRARQVRGERPIGEPYPRILDPQVEIGDGKAV